MKKFFGILVVVTLLFVAFIGVSNIQENNESGSIDLSLIVNEAQASVVMGSRYGWQGTSTYYCYCEMAGGECFCVGQPQ